MEKLKCHTPDFTKENIQKLAALFPNCVVEAKDIRGKPTKAIDFDQLRQELSTSVVEGPRERYHLDWPGKREALLAGNAPIAKTLRPRRDESVQFDSTKNIFIEGDNLEALKLLQETYLNRVKMIYIDPPYNTGKDFIYDDDFRENTDAYLKRSNQQDDSGNRMVANTEANGRFHSEWISMMYPRLKLARNLLRQDGVIFISIDDHEVENVRKMCAEIFGEKNFCAQFVWNTEGNTDNQYHIKVNHEYIVAYYKDIAFADEAIGHVIDPNTPKESNLWKGIADNNVNKNHPANPPAILELPIGFPSNEESLFYPRKKVDDVFFQESRRAGFISEELKARYSIESKSGLPVKLDDLVIENYKLVKPCRIYVGIPLAQVLSNVHAAQLRQNLPLSTTLKSSAGCDINLDIEMETGTGKTYCYIKSMFELNKRYGWSKFIVVVPSIAIREGVHKSLEITTEHFLEQYSKRARFFIYNSKQLHNLESFSSDAGINVMVINVQAFNAKGQDARRIYEELDDFQSRRPIDVISRNRPIVILDEPQKMEGAKTMDSLKEFTPLMILRYSATHKQEHTKIYRLDALDAYNQKLVKKIAVRGITVRGLAGTNAYLYLESINISTSKPPEARAELEIQQVSGIKRVLRKLGKNDNLFDLSDGLEQYRGFVVSDINALDNTVSFTNGVVLQSGEATGDVNESALRRIQIREAVKAHFDKEQVLFHQGIKVLSLFFIDEVAKYRCYNDAGEESGEYARIFEEEYLAQLNEVLTLEDTPYNRYLKGIQPSKTHNGYFSIDKKTKRLVNPEAKARGESAGETDDVDAYDLILKDKERLLSFEEPVRFIFSHSALREGWDNPNVFVICTLKHSDNTISRRQEVGRGLRLSVNQNGDRMDNPATVHQVNVLTVVASESYKDFVSALQKDISASLSERPRKADEAYFSGKVLKTPTGDVPVTPPLAKAIYKYLLKNDYTDADDKIAVAYHEAKKEGKLAALPAELAPHAEQVFQLIDTVFCTSQLPAIEDERKAKVNPLNANFEKKEFQELWNRINRKAAYTVHFETPELIKKCVTALDKELKVSPLLYTIQRGEQTKSASAEALKKGQAFQLEETDTGSLKASVQSSVKYDLIGKIAEETQLTRSTISGILQGMNIAVFGQYKVNPEDFILKTSRIINEQKATVIVEHLAYNPVEDTHTLDIFTQEKPKEDFSKAVKTDRHIYDYVFTDSKNERAFVKDLDSGTEVVVYAKLPRSFFIPTPVGTYNPDWAIAFKQGEVKHIYFIAETKGDLSSMTLRKIEECKIDCARKFFTKITSDQVKYDVVNSYSKLMELVK